MKNGLPKSFLFTSFVLLSVTQCSAADESRPREGGRPAPMTIAVDAESPGDAIPDDFIGLSREPGSVRKDNAGMKGYFFSGDNTQSLRIFELLGIRHLRIGGGSVDSNRVAPTDEEIDRLFSFAAESGVKVVYSLRLLNGDLANEVRVARYVWDRYKEHLDCFAIGNEPDWDSYHTPDPEIRDYPSYLAKWRRFAEAVTAAIPEARFMGPNTGSNYPVSGAKNTNYGENSWTVNFARDLKGTGLLAQLAQHNYVGQHADEKSSPWTMIDKMLSASWNERQYPALYDAVLAPVVREGYTYRLAESNSFSGQCDGGSNSFATALFALDYMHWWARHACSGVNFHNKQWVLNAPIGMDASGGLFVNPVGYGIMAFKFGGRGNILPVAADNPRRANVTAYAVREGKDIRITLINKEHGRDAREAAVTIRLNAGIERIETLSLRSPGNDPASGTALLGGARIDSTAGWQGEWEAHAGTEPVFEIKPASALIVNIRAE